ncbi:MAG: endopeptidase La, partial [Sandaracinaceae bacterium]|nr:endopeptidase La [Sandaracinaceae bacterium]
MLASPLLLYGEGAMNDILSGELSLPILPLRNSVLFPASVVPVNVARKRSIRLVEFLESNERGVLFAVAQRDPTVEDPTISDLYEVGTIARILKIIRLGSRSYSIVLQGMSRARRIEEISTQPFLSGKVAALEPTDTPEEHANAQELLLPLRELAQAYFRELPAPRRDTQNILENVQEIGAMSDLIASNLPVPISEKQSILEELSAFARARRVFALVERRGEVERVRKEIGAMVEDELSRSQRELILRQQLKAIRQELGENDGEEEELEQLRDRVAQAKLPPEAESAARRELRRMSAMSPASAEYQVAR